MGFCACCGAGRSGLPRRRVLAGLAGGTALVAAEAAANPLGDLLGGLVSPEQERQLGEAAFAQIKQQNRLSRNRALQARLEAVAGRVVPASRPAIPPARWEVRVFEGEQINAFALPGGKIGFFEGIFRLMSNDAQLATVVGHEVGHVNARHAAERIGADVATDLGTRLLGQVLGLDPASGLDRLIAGALGAGIQYGVLMPYSRAQELEADVLGLGFMAEAAFDPTEAIGFWAAMMRAGGEKPPAFLSTHPSDRARIAAIEAELPRVVPRYEAARARRG